MFNPGRVWKLLVEAKLELRQGGTEAWSLGMEGGISDLMGFPWQEGQTGGGRLPVQINLVWEVEQANQESQGPEKKPIEQQLSQGKKQSLRQSEWDSLSCSALRHGMSALPWIGSPRSFSISLRTWTIESWSLGPLGQWVHLPLKAVHLFCPWVRQLEEDSSVWCHPWPVLNSMHTFQQ